MNDFWNWLKDKYPIESYLLEQIRLQKGYIREQLLVGFIIEYCTEHDVVFLYSDKF